MPGVYSWWFFAGLPQATFALAAAPMADSLSKDIRSPLYAQPTNYVPGRVAEVGVRTTF